MNLHSLDFLRASPARLVASRLVERLGLTSKSIDTQQLIDLATARAGRRDLGDSHFTESLFSNLDKLLEAIDHGASLNFNGRAVFRQFMVDALSNRLDVVAWDRQHPNVLKAPIVAPIVIIGLPFSGTSHLHQLLAHDPANRAAIAWEVASSVPPPSAYSFAKDPRIDVTDQAFTSLKRRLSTSARLSLLDARVAQDCSLLFAAAGASEAFSVALQIPDYRNWLQSSDMSVSYQWHRQMLQHLQSAYMGERWLLKSPQHLAHLPALTATYPDARFVFVHRNPEHAMIEYLNFSRQLRRILHVRPSVEADTYAEITYWAAAIDRATAFFASNPQFAVAHVRHSDLMRRPLKTVETIYETLAPTFSQPAYKRIDDYVNRQLAIRSAESPWARVLPKVVNPQLNEQIAAAFETYADAFAEQVI